MADTTTETRKPLIAPGTGTEILTSLIWLGTGMFTAHAMIKGTQEDLSGALGSAAAALPGLIAAALITGASIGHTAGARYATAGGRLLAGLLFGGLFGVITAAGIRFAYGSESSIMVLAVTVGAATALGGAAAALPEALLGAGLWATNWVFFAGVIFGVLQLPLTTMRGGEITADTATEPSSDIRFVIGQSILTGVLAAYFARNGLNGEKPPFIWYPLAGALPGLFLLAAEGLTRLGGSSVVNMVTGFTGGEPTLLDLSDFGRLRDAVIVLVVGFLVATIGGLRARSREE